MLDRFNAGQAGTIWYYRTLAAAFRRLLPGALSRELAEAVDLMETLSRAPDAASRGDLPSLKPQ